MIPASIDSIGNPGIFVESVAVGWVVSAVPGVVPGVTPAVVIVLSITSVIV